MTTKKKAYEGPSPEEVLVQDLITLMETNQSPWRKDWDPMHTAHRNVFTGHLYQGTNIMLLTMGYFLRGYRYPFWCGFNQAQKNKLKIKKGSKSVRILQPVVVTAERELEDGQIEQYGFRRYKVVPVFNIDDFDGDKQPLIDKYLSQMVMRNTAERLAAADTILDPWPVEIKHGLNTPCYLPDADKILMPELGSFHSTEGYYATRIHEMVHSTGHKSRLDRDMGGKFGSVKYAKEELVAELGAVLLCNRLQISTNFESHAAYLKSWIAILKEEPKFLFQALSQARKAADLIYHEEVEHAPNQPGD